jgi:uncharacterized protein
MMLRLCLKQYFISLFILTTTLLSGCFGVNPVTPTRLYILNPVEYEIPLVNGMESLPLLSVEIASLRLPQYLEKPQIITRSHQNQLTMAEYHQWGGNLRKNMTRVLAQNISRLLATPNVTIPPFRASPPPDIRVDVEVMQFEADDKGQVKFSAQWRLSRGKNGKPLTTRITEIKSQVPGGGSDFDPIVLAMGKLLGDFSHIMAREILDQTMETPGQ